MNRRPYPAFPAFLTPELSRSFESFLSPASASLGNLRDSILSPRTDVRECGQHYAISVDMPGVALDDIEIEVNDGLLTIKGERRNQSVKEESGAHHIERIMGTFQRRFVLPDNVDFESVSATSRDGVLEVRVPKLPERAPRKVKVQAVADGAGSNRSSKKQITEESSTQEA